MNPKVIKLPDCAVVVQGVHCHHHMCDTSVVLMLSNIIGHSLETDIQVDCGKYYK